MINSQQIGNIQSLNSLVGGLATNATSLLMGGNANFNLLSYKGVGMLEFSFGKDGISSKIGMGGTNISYQNLVSAFGGATHLHVNRQIDNTEYDKTTQDALKSQYGYGDEQAKAQLDDIINGDTVLKFDAEGSEVAQSVTENGQKIIHINSTLNDGFIDLGLTLQHEAHRDGIVGDEQSQQIETTNAVLGHTVMAKKMQNDSLYSSMMNDIIDTNQNLQNDLAVFDYAVETGDWGAFGSYANAAYDSSADYWKLMDDGSLAYDGKANLYDENGNLIYKTDSQGIQGSLQEILGLENQTEAYNLMIQAGMKWDGKSWKNSSNPTDGSLAIKMDMTTGENGTGRTYQEIYKTRVLTDSLTGYTATLEQHNPVNIYNMMVSCSLGPVTYDYSATTMSNGEWNGRLPERQLSYEEWKANNYIDNPSLGMIMLGKPLEDDSNVTSEYGMRKNPFNQNKIDFHAGTDHSTPEGTPILALSNGVVNFVGDIGDGGNAVIIQHNMTYSYKTDFITSNYYTDYFHLQNGNINGVNSNYSVGQTVLTSNILGYSGNTGTSTGPHLHTAIHFTSINDNPYANWLYQQNYLDKYDKNNWYSNISNFQR